jgi:hypothetical protein
MQYQICQEKKKNPAISPHFIIIIIIIIKK